MEVNITKIIPELRIPELAIREPVQSESIGELRSCGVGLRCRGIRVAHVEKKGLHRAILIVGLNLKSKTMCFKRTSRNLSSQLAFPWKSFRENCRRRLAAEFGIGSRLLLSQGKDGRNLLEDDVQLESLLEDEKIEINYLKGFDHPHIMKLLEDIQRTSDPGSQKK